MTREERVARMIAGRAIALRSEVKAAATLTSPKATTQARRIVDRIMPGVGATVESRLSHDLTTDIPIVITTITFPARHHNRMGLKLACQSLPGVRRVDGLEAGWITVERKR